MAYRIQKKPSESLVAVHTAPTDPWSAANLNLGESKDSWMLSYIDVLTLLLTLLVLLLAYQRIEHEDKVSSSFPINRENKVADKERGQGLAEQQAISSDSDVAEQRDKPFLLVGGSSMSGESKVAEEEHRVKLDDKQPISNDPEHGEHHNKPFVLIEEPTVVAAVEQISSLFDKVIDTAAALAKSEDSPEKPKAIGDEINPTAESDTKKTSIKDLALAVVNEVTESTKDLPIVDIAALESFVENVKKAISAESEDLPSDKSKLDSPMQENEKKIVAAADLKVNVGATETSSTQDTESQKNLEKAMEKVASNEKVDSKEKKPVGDSDSKLSPVEGERLFRGTSDVLKANVLITELANSDNDLVEITQEGRSIRIEINDGVLFGSGKGELKAGAGTLLNDWIDLLKQQKGTIFVEGHTDSIPISTPRFPSNWELSSARAGSVTRYFLEQGIDPARLRAVGYADTHPRGDNNTPEGRKKNRRVSIVIQP